MLEVIVVFTACGILVGAVWWLHNIIKKWGAE